ncbi:MAG: hypothetical protein KAV87_13650 [Desulfobacteraceae bacterium]|nr:hypothetical protein [Desulfobacteraceae bacterium]
MSDEMTARCNNCGFVADADQFDAAMSVYTDLICPKCRTTNIDTSDLAKKIPDYCYGDDNSLVIKQREAPKHGKG